MSPDESVVRFAQGPFCARFLESIKHIQLSVTVAALVFAAALQSYAEESSIRAPAAAEEKSSPQESSSSEGANLSEGFSVRESVALGRESDWSSVASAGFNRYMDEFAVTSWSVGGSLNYRLSQSDSLGLTAGYSAPTELVTAAPENYGMSDLEISWARRNVWKSDRWGSVSSSVKWRLPTSELSQRTTQISSFSGALTLRRPMPIQSVLRNLTLSATTAVVLTPHQYDRRAIGALNSPFGLTYGAGGTYNLWQKLNLSTSYSMYHRFEYDGYMQRIQTLQAGAVLTLPESMFLSGGYQWRDSVLTNDPFLDADKTLAYLELSRAF